MRERKLKDWGEEIACIFNSLRTWGTGVIIANILLKIKKGD
jgi:hypothetical protein